MEKTIICLSSPGNTGKTSTIWKLFEILGGKNRKYYPEVEDKVLYRNYKIGCMSTGDPGSSQEESLEKLLKEGCDIVVTACRSYGGTVEIVEKLAVKYKYKVMRFSHIYLYDDFGDALFNLSHEGNIKFIFTIIDKLIAGEI